MVTASDILLLQEEANRHYYAFKRVEQTLYGVFSITAEPSKIKTFTLHSLQRREQHLNRQTFCHCPTGEQIGAYLNRYTSEFAKIEQAHKQRYGVERTDAQKQALALSDELVEEATAADTSIRPLYFLRNFGVQTQLKA